MRCVHSPSWSQVTAGCGCGPIRPETPAGAPTGWSPWRFHRGGWWWWRRWPHRGLGCNALGERDGKLVSPVLQLQQLRRGRDRSAGLILCCETPLSLQSTCSLRRMGEARSNKHSDPSAAICVAQPRPFPAFPRSQHNSHLWSAHKFY